MGQQALFKKDLRIVVARIVAGALVPGLVAMSAAQASGTSGTSGSSSGFAAGPRAAKIVFRQANPQGSFDAPPPNGTPPVPGGGLRAVRVFNPDGTLLASGGSGTPNWPKWLSAVEIGISGTNNTSADNPDCARFAQTSEDVSAICKWDGTNASSCGAPPGLFRVSEWDCAGSQVGTGGPNDGIYVRVQFSRNTANLGPSENIMAVIEYSASALSPGPTNPTTCFTNGAFNPSATGCADQVWQIFLKHTVQEMTQPFLMLVPPAYAHVNKATNSSGAGISTRQFFLPLASDPSASVMQLSRISGRAQDPAFNTACNPDGNGSANSALCVGLVIYSMTFFRI